MSGLTLKPTVAGIGPAAVVASGGQAAECHALDHLAERVEVVAVGADRLKLMGRPVVRLAGRHLGARITLPRGDYSPLASGFPRGMGIGTDR